MTIGLYHIDQRKEDFLSQYLIYIIQQLLNTKKILSLEIMFAKMCQL